MLDRLIQLDKDFLIYLNGLHTPWLDPVMFFISKTYVWLPFYAFLLFLIYKKYGKDTWIVLVGIALAILLADRFTTGFMKPFFLRLRPSHQPGVQEHLHFINNYKGGLFGFASSHAADTFAAAMFFWLIFRDSYKKTIWLIFLWASIVSYSRIYLGVHYPGDALVGGLLGLLFGWMGYRLFVLVKTKFHKEKTSSI